VIFKDAKAYLKIVPSDREAVFRPTFQKANTEGVCTHACVFSFSNGVYRPEPTVLQGKYPPNQRNILTEYENSVFYRCKADHRENTMIKIESLPQDFQNAIQEIGTAPITIDADLEITAKLEEAISSADTNFATLAQAVTILEQHNQHRLIIALCEKALELFPKNPTIHEYLAKHYNAIDSYNKALDHFKKALELVSFDEYTRTYLINTYDQFIEYAQGLQKHEEIIWALKKKSAESISLDAGDLNNWGDALQKLGDDDTAKDKYIEAIIKYPTYSISHIALAEMALKKKDFDTAHKYIQSAKKALKHPSWDEAAQTESVKMAKALMQEQITYFEQKYEDQKAFLNDTLDQ